MKCDRCDSEASVHEVTIKGGKRHEKHLCERCAQATGVGVPVSTPLTELLSQYVSLQAVAGNPLAKGQALAPSGEMCPACGTSFADFRQHEKLGCMHCYSTFERQIGGLLERLHLGATHHVGKTPRRLLAASTALPVSSRAVQSPGGEGVPAPRVIVLTAPQLLKRIASLKQKLDEAVAAEQYEKAARLRDELTKLQDLLPQGPSSGLSPQAGDRE